MNFVHRDYLGGCSTTDADRHCSPLKTGGHAPRQRLSGVLLVWGQEVRKEWRLSLENIAYRVCKDCRKRRCLCVTGYESRGLSTFDG